MRIRYVESGTITASEIKNIGIPIETQIQNIRNTFAAVQAYLLRLTKRQTGLDTLPSIASYSEIQVGENVSITLEIYWYSLEQPDDSELEKFLGEIGLEHDCTITVDKLNYASYSIQDKLAWCSSILITANALK